MDTAEQSRNQRKLGPVSQQVAGMFGYWRNLTPRQRRHLLGCVGFILLLTAAFARPLISLAVYAANKNLHSHILLVPLVSAYILYLQRGQLPKDFRCSPAWAMLPIIIGLAALAAALILGTEAGGLSVNDFLALIALSYICLLAGGGFLFLGRKWMASAAFPVAFLIFMVPLPDRMVAVLETASTLASTEAADLFFRISRTPVFREGAVMHLPGITIEVARECSGIRSSWVLFITSLLASYLFLKNPWRRAAVVLATIPLGVMRNGFRILVIGLLCVHLGPEQIDGPIHKKGGPGFFVLSLIPLFLLLWWMRRKEARAEE